VAARPLDAQESRAWRGFHQMRAELGAYLAQQLGRQSGLTEADYAVLVALSEAPCRRMRARDLGRRLGWERSRLSHQVDRMQARGTVERTACESDARGFDVVLTEAGFSAIESAAPQHLEVVRHCFADVLTPEQLKALGDIAETIVRHLAAEHADDLGDCR